MGLVRVVPFFCVVLTRGVGNVDGGFSVSMHDSQPYTQPYHSRVSFCLTSLSPMISFQGLKVAEFYKAKGGAQSLVKRVDLHLTGYANGH